MIRMWSAAVVASLLGIVSFAPPAAAKTLNVDLFPVLGLAHVTSPDRPFIMQAWHESIATMKRSRTRIAQTRLANVQAEAVRAYNTAAEAYNGLIDLALARGIRLPEENSLFAQETTPTPIDGTPILPQDIAYFTDRQGELREAIAFYRKEAAHGKDAKLAAFAAAYSGHLERDLALTTATFADLTSSAGYGDRRSEADSTAGDR